MSRKYIPHALMLSAVLVVTVGYWRYMMGNSPYVYDEYAPRPAASAAGARSVPSTGFGYPEDSERVEPPRLVVLDAAAVMQGFKPGEVCKDVLNQLKDMPVAKFTPMTITPKGEAPMRFLIPAYRYEVDTTYCPGMHRDDRTQQVMQNGNPIAFWQQPTKR